jgi:hypothetical protein
MNRDGHNNAAFFIGPEVEHTPAFSKKTLFVVGKQDVATIEKLAREHRAPHIFMGANHSFVAVGPADMYWDETITALLDKGFWITLDYEAHKHEVVLKMLNPGIWQSRLFIPLLSVRIPNIQTSSINLTIKIDDIDFKATNAGVWCLNHHEITDSNRFTDWQDYGTDVVISEEPGAPPAVPVYADINKPVLDLEAVRQRIETSDVVTIKNEVELGLDLEGKSKLKPDPVAEETKAVIAIANPQDAAEAYAAGAKEDPLSATGSKKPVRAKK